MKSQKKTKSTNGSSRLTMIIIPQSQETPLRFSVSKTTLRVAALLVVLFVVVSAGIAALYGTKQADYNKLEAIKEDSLRKDQTIELLDQQIKAIEQQQERLLSKQADIKKMMGVQEDVPVTTESSGGGKGGSGPTRDALVTGEDSYLMAQQIKNQLDLQEKELDELLAKVNNDKAYFRSLPNQWPTSGEISSYYGWRKSPFGGRSESFHDGIDIANDSGTEVCAAADGQVVFAGWQPVYGRTILIEHGHGFATKYAHNSALLVEEGDRVKKGQVIARMGTSGRSTGPHLHFSIMKWDQTLDPLIYLPDPLGE
ncbi:MAG TPA: M23 family metallopeptidase [Syntrophomonadaceae bacterium]|jgi:murein DD-endopeptidase MepM/ murein hydrolase activator NlpD|nr:M23 family metallopeptidase [Syntrophomonadaceae bacterium]HQD89564.1 M23 family metallopeptidase [Syntrophomonadaceae bacterium]